MSQARKPADSGGADAASMGLSRPMFGYLVATAIACGAPVLTDDYNPVDFFDLPLKEMVRRGVLATTDWDILVN